MGLGSGGKTTTKLYSCSDKELCLNVEIAEKTLKAKDTLYGKIRTLLASIIVKIKQNEADFNDDEKNLISLSSLPLIRKIQIDLSISPNHPATTTPDFIEVLALDVATSHLTRLLNETAEAVAELSGQQLVDISVFDKFDTDVQNTIRLLTNAKHFAFKRYETIAATRARMQKAEEYFDASFGDFLNSNESDG